MATSITLVVRTSRGRKEEAEVVKHRDRGQKV
jgi:hypothetical protein